jgi:hypothetical protein
MDCIDELVIKFTVDNIPFEASILPDGRYKIFGPLWSRGGAQPLLACGILGFGFALPGLQRSLTELVKLKLKS